MRVDMRQRIALRDLFRSKLCEAAKERHLREFTIPGPDGGYPEMGWMLYERLVMHGAVNAELQSRGLPDAEPDQILRIERGAEGHSDYADTYALRCAFLIEEAQALRSGQDASG